jgi:hypothetical protein
MILAGLITGFLPGVAAKKARGRAARPHLAEQKRPMYRRWEEHEQCKMKNAK